MATTTPTSSEAPAAYRPPDIFCQDAASLVVLATPQEAEDWLRVFALLRQGTHSRAIEHYIALKIMCPEESRNLVMNNLAEVHQVLETIVGKLASNFIREIEEARR